MPRILSLICRHNHPIRLRQFLNPFKASAASAAFTQKIGRCAIEKFQDVANACSTSMSDANCTLEDEPGTQAPGYVPQLWTKEKQLRPGYLQFPLFLWKKSSNRNPNQRALKQIQNIGTSILSQSSIDVSMI